MFKKKLLIVCFIFLGLGSISCRALTNFGEPSAKYLETDSPKLMHIREELKDLKKELVKKGLYTCCIKNDCNWCAIHMGHCPCAKLVIRKGNEKSCPECAAAWNRKQGKFPSVHPDAIEVTTFGIYGFEESSHDNQNKGSNH